MEHWGKTIRRLREAVNMSQTELARACKVSPPSVSDWESGKTRMIDGENLVKAAAALGVTPEEIMGRLTPSLNRVRESSSPYIVQSPVANLYTAAVRAFESGVITSDYIAAMTMMLNALIESSPKRT